MTEAELADLFARLGAREPDAWARSQINENIPQLARFLFLRQAWKLVGPEEDRPWIAQEMQEMNMDAQGPGGTVVDWTIGAAFVQRRGHRQHVRLQHKVVGEPKIRACLDTWLKAAYDALRGG